jgi:predicted nucleotidyltransferase component of viral defense system
VSAEAAPRRLWGHAFALDDLLAGYGGSREFAVRDFALLTLALQLSARFPGQLVFKGGFVLRHVHGIERFSEDVDATRHDPPKNKFDALEVADAIRDSSVGDIIRFAPQDPATDSAISLDFDNVRVSGTMLPNTQVQVEISYREEVIDDPVRAMIGAPFYDPFEILAMSVSEMTAEKLRCIAQRVRVTDLADLAELLGTSGCTQFDVARLAEYKFQKGIVRTGRDNRVGRIEQHINEMAADYDDVVPTLFPGAMSYREAKAAVWPRIKSLIPS